MLAYALSPSVDWLARRRVPRMVAVGLVETAALIALLAVLLLVLPILNKELPRCANRFRPAKALNESLAPWLAQHGVQVSLDIASVKAFVLKYLNANLGLGRCGLRISPRGR